MEEERRPRAQLGGGLASDAPEAISAGLSTDRQAAAKAAGSAGRLLSVVFLAAVVACVVVPLLETLHPFFGTVVEPVDEHRAANRFPSPWLLLRANGDFADEL